MAEHNTAQTDVTQSNVNSDTKTDKKHIDVFKRREPLTFSPKREYCLAVIAPLQKHDSCETVFADGSFSGTSSPAHSNDTLEEIFEIPRRRRRERRRNVTPFEPFSFDERDAVRKVERERRLQEMRQERLWCPEFKAHPVRRYKPLQPLDSTRPVHNSLNDV